MFSLRGGHFSRERRTRKCKDFEDKIFMSKLAVKSVNQKLEQEKLKTSSLENDTRMLLEENRTTKKQLQEQIEECMTSEDTKKGLQKCLERMENEHKRKCSIMEMKLMDALERNKVIMVEKEQEKLANQILLCEMQNKLNAAARKFEDSKQELEQIIAENHRTIKDLEEELVKFLQISKVSISTQTQSRKERNKLKRFWGTVSNTEPNDKKK